MTDNKAALYSALINLIAGIVPALVAIGRRDVAEDLEAFLTRADSKYRRVIDVADTRTGDAGSVPGGTGNL